MKKYRASMFGGVPRQPSYARPDARKTRHRAKKHSAPGGKPSVTQRGAKDGGRKKRGFASLLSLLVVFAGLGLLGYSVLDAGPAITGVVRATLGTAEAPETTSMKLTVPEMSRVENDPVYTAAASDSATLDQGAVHVDGTGFPWDDEANVYIAGHRLGYPGTGSFLQFQDLDRLENGDEIILTDDNGAKYTYTVFDKMTVAPDDYQVTAPIPGKNIVSLQTCTLPDYSERLIVQGELTSIA